MGWWKTTRFRLSLECEIASFLAIRFQIDTRLLLPRCSIPSQQYEIMNLSESDLSDSDDTRSSRKTNGPIIVTDV